MTYEATPSVTSSPASADGATPPGSPDGTTTGRSGRARAPASRSRSRAKVEAPTIHGICGPTSFASSPPAGPLWSWESRLRERLATVGSTECALIWREKTTPAGASISRLAPWTPPTSDNGSTGSPWSTPRASDGEKGGPNQSFGAGGQPLPAQMHKSAWPTPTKADLEGGRANPPGTSPTGVRPDGKKAQVGLPAVMKGTWRTPTVGDVDATMHADTQGQVMLARQMADATEPSGPAPNGSPATTEKRGAPNPEFPCWLMGFPTAWVSGGASVTRSSRKSRPK